ncbi:hypothetical protein J8M20_10790 [Pseudoalteromonas luteoviolacea]|uniref:hypothetical protein n=1 Tax=Pseudoalteromonas luteoviolacea TaxID=43657 RepID=UPI001B37CD80|nr:hypothetical protein [Pseudoalteromonas luteoviolacea]MBQ4811827.1 hypothetical protein [Pseudoalteromonas luteoviolacea]
MGCKSVDVGQVMVSFEEEVRQVEERLDKQEFMGAALGSVIGAAISIAIWFQLYLFNPKLGFIMFPVSGAIIGQFVRFFGRGYHDWFATIACMVYAVTVWVAWYMQIVVSERMSVSILIGLFFSGCAAANYFAKLSMPLELSEAFKHLIYEDRYPKKGTNIKGFAAVIFASTLALGVTYGITFMYVIFNHQLQSAKAASVEQTQQQRPTLKGIEVTEDVLSQLTTSQALLYAHAYFSGYKFNEFGSYTRGFPRSIHKSQMILEYLMKARADRRAQFILGVLLQGNRGERLVNTAAEKGDHYAALYQAFYAGCNQGSAAGNRILDTIYPLVTESAIKSEIESVRSYGYEPVCDEISMAHFPHSFVRGYIGQFRR